MTFLNAFVARAFDLLLLPFRQLPPIAGLAVVSLLTAVAMLLVFRATSDQRRIEDVKRRMVAALFEIRLFNDDLPALFRAQGELLKQNAVYLRLSLIPMVWMIVPIGIVAAHLQFQYGYRGLTPGQPALVKAQLGHPVPPPESRRIDVAAPPSRAIPDAALQAPKEVRVLTSAIWFPATQEVVWRVTPDAPGEYLLNATIDGGTFPKTLEATDRVVRRSPKRVEAGALNQLLYPAEDPLPNGVEVTSIVVSYPARAIRIVRWDVPWLVVYFALSIAFAFLLRRPLGVTL